MKPRPRECTPHSCYMAGRYQEGFTPRFVWPVPMLLLLYSAWGEEQLKLPQERESG